LIDNNTKKGTKYEEPSHVDHHNMTIDSRNIRNNIANTVTGDHNAQKVHQQDPHHRDKPCM